MTQDQRSTDQLAYTYNHAGRMATAKKNGTTEATYTYTANGLLAVRAVTGANPIHHVHDLAGNLIAEIDGPTGSTLREYIWLPDDEIAPTSETAAPPLPARWPWSTCPQAQRMWCMLITSTGPS